MSRRKRGGVTIHQAGNVALLMSDFEKDGNLVSFASDECVVHSRQL